MAALEKTLTAIVLFGTPPAAITMALLGYPGFGLSMGVGWMIWAKWG